MKKIILTSATALVLFSCTNLQTQLPSQNKVVVPNVKNPVLQQDNFFLNESGVAYLYDLIQRDSSTNSIREYLPSQIMAPMEVYTGETLIVNNINADRVKIISSPIKSDFTFNINNNNLTFNSPYQGEYIAEIYSGFAYIGTVKIKNKLKYNFTEKDNYGIILNGYNNKNLDLLVKSAQLYLAAFPTNSKQKDVAFMVLDLSSINGNQLLINKEIRYLKENFSLNEDEKIKLLNFEEKSNSGNFVINNYYLDYNRNNLKLNTEIMRTIQRKNNANTDELQFLEKFYGDSQSSELALLIGNLYTQSGDSDKGNYYLSLAGNASSSNSNFLPLTSPEQETSIPQTEEVYTSPVSSDSSKDLSNGIDALNRKSYNEALIFFNKASNSSADISEVSFYRGKTYFSMNNFDKALSDFDKVSNPGENTSELYYYLGVIYHKKGDIEKAKDYLRKSRENNPSSTWGRKSSIYLLKL
ncbi:MULTISPECIES: tetratricopeptide repeat protein [Cetobacterium]|jgi:tetratricopeptide (TPR) repeat protein|uniref:Tetratricopeptide repeat protein n=1 Tax=Candidatus Cetobacterium colombiensis TaxID=3073100 RepID=A0ABU4W9L4_9FUSO|nr:tetratricopeptide repeat protein [Candidatus Cetobacterium colombiensis]MDX8336221.1 tetratricopeptide repeat protein [Candidatus Cetobacterium colombiensis]